MGWLEAIFYKCMQKPELLWPELKVWNMSCHRFKSLPIQEQQVYSQHGEDGIIASILAVVWPQRNYFVEIGCEDGTVCNTRYLAEQRFWGGFKIDQGFSVPERNIHQHTVTYQNACQLLQQYHCPTQFDFLSVDIDCTDWHVLHAILREYRPRVICVEYNCAFGEHDVVVPAEHTVWEGDNCYYGASYTAFYNLAKFWEYSVCYCDSSATNLFMIRDDLCPAEIREFTGSLFVDGEHWGNDPLHRPLFPSSLFLGVKR